MNFDVILFETKDGTCPVSDFINSFDVKMKSKVLRMIGLLGKNGNELREPYTKYLKDGIFELRVQQGNDLSRVLYFFKSGQKIIMTNGFIKKTQKTPVNEIALAKRYMAEYEEYVREGKRK
jgi:Phage-related protein